MKYAIHVGCGVLDKPMTIKGALRWGKANMPADLKRAGFQTFAGVAPTWLTGADIEYVRVSYGRKF